MSSTFIQLPAPDATELILANDHILVGNAANMAASVVMSGDALLSNAGVLTITTNAVTNAKLAQMAAHTFKGNNTGSTANPIDLTATQLTAELNVFTSTLKGLVPLSGGGTSNFLRADGTWATPSGGGGSPGGSSGQFQYNNGGAFGGTADLVVHPINGNPNVVTKLSINSSPSGMADSGYIGINPDVANEFGLFSSNIDPNIPIAAFDPGGNQFVYANGNIINNLDAEGTTFAGGGGINTSNGGMQIYGDTTLTDPTFGPYPTSLAIRPDLSVLDTDIKLFTYGNDPSNSQDGPGEINWSNYTSGQGALIFQSSGGVLTSITVGAINANGNITCDASISGNQITSSDNMFTPAQVIAGAGFTTDSGGVNISDTVAFVPAVQTASYVTLIDPTLGSYQTSIAIRPDLDISGSILLMSFGQDSGNVLGGPGSIVWTGVAATLQFLNGTGLGMKVSTGPLHATNSTGQASFPVGGTLFSHYADVGNTTTTETTLYLDNIPGNTFVSDGDSTFTEWSGIFVVSATATRTLRVRLGGGAAIMLDTGALTIAVGADAWEVTVVLIRDSSTSLRCCVTASAAGAAVTSYVTYHTVTGLDLTASVPLYITGQAAGTGAASNDIVAKLGYTQFQPTPA